MKISMRWGRFPAYGVYWFHIASHFWLVHSSVSLSIHNWVLMMRHPCTKLLAFGFLNFNPIQYVVRMVPNVMIHGLATWWKLHGIYFLHVMFNQFAELLQWVWNSILAIIEAIVYTRYIETWYPFRNEKDLMQIIDFPILPGMFTFHHTFILLNTITKLLSDKKH